MSRFLSTVSHSFWEKKVNPFNRQISEEFLIQGHLSPKTIKQYKSCLRQFFRWVYYECENRALHELKPRDGLKFQNMLINLGLSSNAIRIKRSSVSSLCLFLETYHPDKFPLFRNIFNRSIPTPAKVLRYERNPLTDEEFMVLIQELKKMNRTQLLAYTLFTYTSGCRREESRQLRKEVIDYEKSEGKNYYATHLIRAKGRGKDGKVRRFQFDDLTMYYLKKWIKERGNDECPYMFVSIKGNKVNQVNATTFNYWCANVFSKILNRRVHPHLFRITRATHLDALGVKIEDTQTLLGHENVSVTAGYIVKDREKGLDNIFI